MKQLPDALQHVTESGLTLNLSPVRLVLVELALNVIADEMRNAGEPVNSPTLVVELAGGGHETLEHVYDPENGINTLEEPDDPRATAINYARWRAHEKALAKLETLQTERRLQEMFKQGVDFTMPKNIDGWEADVAEKSRGQAEIPPDEPGNGAERAFLWLWYTQLSQMDVQQVHLKLMVLSQGRLFSEEQFRELQESVQSNVANSVWSSFVETFGAPDGAEPGDGAEAVGPE